jgi:hypothetical protein
LKLPLVHSNPKNLTDLTPRKDIVLYTSVDNKENFVIQILIVSSEGEEVINDDNHPFEEIFENCNHDLLEAETSIWDTLLHEE